MVSPESQFSYVTAQLQHHTQAVSGAFVTFFQLYSATAGGYIIMRSQSEVPATLRWLKIGTPVMLLALGLGFMVLIAVHMATKLRYQHEIAHLLEQPETAPRFPGAVLSELAMIALIGLVSLVTTVILSL